MFSKPGHEVEPEGRHNTSCSLCGALSIVWRRDVESVFTRKMHVNRYELSRCTGCSHLETQPSPPDHVLAEIYRNMYPYDIHRAIRNEKSLRAINLLRDFRVDPESRAVLCDLGCGGGELVESAAALGYQAVGVDFASSVFHSNDFRFIETDIENFVEQRSSVRYQIVVMSHSLEHQKSPTRILECIRLNLLARDGHLVVALPNADSRTAKIFGSKWGYLQVPVHLHHFNPKSFGCLASSAGFEIVARRVRGGDSLSFALTLMNVLGMSSRRPTRARVMVAKVWSFIFRWWMFVGDEDLVYVLKHKAIVTSSIQD